MKIKTLLVAILAMASAFSTQAQLPFDLGDLIQKTGDQDVIYTLEPNVESLESKGFVRVNEDRPDEDFYEWGEDYAFKEYCYITLYPAKMQSEWILNHFLTREFERVDENTTEWEEDSVVVPIESIEIVGDSVATEYDYNEIAEVIEITDEEVTYEVVDEDQNEYAEFYIVQINKPSLKKVLTEKLLEFGFEEIAIDNYGIYDSSGEPKIATIIDTVEQTYLIIRRVATKI